MSGYRLYDERGGRRPLTPEEAEPVTVTLPREAMQRVHELLVHRAVTCETAEDTACTGLGSETWRWPADEIRKALAAPTIGTEEKG